mmetsp:Transcript_19949/g.59275  ORF Transcript_19949/g.59275 Transcript_19949/m.59275 type:complete len:104 (-) Transcript_19949:927-1238(-)
MRKIKKRCKVAEARAANAGAEVTEARLKCHELELLASHLPDVTGPRDASAAAAATLPGRPNLTASSLELGGFNAELAALRLRQQGYLGGATRQVLAAADAGGK